MCGATLKVSDASSGMIMYVEPHECQGWKAWADWLDKQLKLNGYIDGSESTPTDPHD